MTESLKNLQNGSDIRGIASKGIPGEEVNLTPSIAEKLAIAFVQWLSKKENTDASVLKIAVGMDSRISGPSLKEAFIRGATLCGSKVYDCGMATTPAMFMATQFDEIKCHGSVMVTASHLPLNRNGFKFFTSKSGIEKEDISAILDIAQSIANSDSSKKGEVVPYKLIDRYANFLCEFIINRTGKKTPLLNQKIIVDAGNGAGGFFADKILARLGADITGSQFLEPDGMFPNHMPNPENEEAINSLRQAVIQYNAKLGIIFDTDVDRAAVVDEKGKPINRNALIALLSAIILEEHPQSVIVTDSVTSNGLASFIAAKNGIHLRFKRGYRNVINKSIDINQEGKESWLAIETSGHAALRENYFLDDGAFIVAKILVKFADLTEKHQSLSNLISDLKEPILEKEFRLKINREDFAAYGTEIIRRLPEYASGIKGWELVKENYEGVRVQCDENSGNGWLLLRMSLHEPLLPLNVESESIDGFSFILSKLYDFLKEFSYLDIKSMR